MCLGSKPKPVPPPVIQPAPRRDEAAATATSERRRLKTQQGVYGNVFTSVLGDPTYNTNVARPASGQAVATLGG